MVTWLRADLRTVVVAAVVAAATAGAPALAHGVRHALFAHNSDKVDGKHAVGAKATLRRAGGKLVAHGANGKLAARFVPKVGAASSADNADQLDGIDSTGFYRAGSQVADADRLDGLSSSSFYRAGSKVADAGRLDGLDSSAFVGRCRIGSIHGFVRVNGNTAIPSDFSTTGTSVGYNCAGSAPRVARWFDGYYAICFPNSSSRVGIGNALYMSESSDQDNFLNWHRSSHPDCSGGVFVVLIRDNDGSLEDAPFFFAAL